VEVSDVGEETADVDDDQADAQRLGLEVEELSAFRSTGCKNAKIANKIELFTTRPSRQARALIPIGAVFSVGSGKNKSIKCHGGREKGPPFSISLKKCLFTFILNN